MWILSVFGCPVRGSVEVSAGGRLMFVGTTLHLTGSSGIPVKCPPTGRLTGLEFLESCWRSWLMVLVLDRENLRRTTGDRDERGQPRGNVVRVASFPPYIAAAGRPAAQCPGPRRGCRRAAAR